MDSTPKRNLGCYWWIPPPPPAENYEWEIQTREINLKLALNKLVPNINNNNSHLSKTWRLRRRKKRREKGAFLSRKWRREGNEGERGGALYHFEKETEERGEGERENRSLCYYVRHHSPVFSSLSEANKTTFFPPCVFRIEMTCILWRTQTPSSSTLPFF